MNPEFTRIGCAFAVAALLMSSARVARADVVLEWNAIAVRTLTTQTPPVNPFEQARLATIVQLAVFEAVNAVTGDSGVVTLTYRSLKQICDDIDDARIYGGIDFRFDQEAGARLGRDVATSTYKSNLQPIHGAQ